MLCPNPKTVWVRKHEIIDFQAGQVERSVIRLQILFHASRSRKKAMVKSTICCK